MAVINSYAGLNLFGSLRFGKQEAEFPANPKVGQTCFKGGILFIYADLNGFKTWYPLNKPQSSYVHSQGLPSLQWTINHGLATTDIIVAVYDEGGHAVNCSVETRYTPDNPDGQRYQAILTFTEAMAGVAVIFGTESISAAPMTVEHIEAESVLVGGSPVIAQGDSVDCGEL